MYKAGVSQSIAVLRQYLAKNSLEHSLDIKTCCWYAWRVSYADGDTDGEHHDGRIRFEQL